MQIYRNNIFETYTETLKNIYPTIFRVVGEGFFTSTANQYIKNYPSSAGDLSQFGHNFAEFLATFQPAQILVYLPDIAKLEWAYHQVFHSADHSPFNLLDLNTIPEEQYKKLKFKLHPASRLLTFQFPILKIWQMCQDQNHSENVNLDEGDENILIIRPRLNVHLRKLANGEFAFLSALNDELTFEEACRMAFEIEQDFDLNTQVQKYILNGTIVNFTL